MIGVGCLGVSALAQTTGIPWTPVNLTGAPVTVAVVDSFGNVQGSLVATAGSSGTLWVPIPPGGVARGLMQLTRSGTNGMTISFISNAPAVSGDSWPQVNWTWFWAGFGMFASFFGFTWALRFTKQIGRVNPEP